MKNKFKLNALVAASTLVLGASALPVQAQEALALSGNIGVFSKYVLRGIQQGGSEAVTPALQGGFDLSHKSGLYAGYWGSNLGYANDAGEAGFENDFYAGFAGEIVGLSYDIGATYYKYLSVADSDSPEISFSAGYGPVSLGMKYLVSDVSWGNAGDIYWTAGYSADLPKKFSVSATVGYYTYTNSGEFIASSAIDSGFRHLDISISHPIGDTGADMSVTGIYGGVDRNDVDQGSTVVLGVSYGFDI